MALLHVYRGHDGDVNHCDWSPVQPYIASAGGDKVIRIWDTNTGQELAQSPLKGHSYYVNSCVFSPNGDLLASSSSDGTVKLWSTTTWKIVGTLTGHKGSVKMCCFSPDGALIASSGGDETVRVWDTNAMNCVSVFEKHDCSVNCCSFASVGWLLVSGGSSGEIILSDVFAKKFLKKVFAHDMGVSWCVFACSYSSEDTFLLATAGQDSVVKLWTVQLSTREIIKLTWSLQGHSSAVYSCQFSPNFEHIVTGSADKTVIVWNVKEGKVVKKIDAHSRYVTYCCFSPDGEKIASTSNDKLLKIWTISEPEVENHPATSESNLGPVPSAPPREQVTEVGAFPKQAFSDVCTWLNSVVDSQCSLIGDQSDEVTKLSQLVKTVQSISTPERDDSIEHHLKCPITHELFKDPVIATDGHTYERSAIISWFSEGNRRSPVTNVMLPNTMLIQNHCVKTILHQLGQNNEQ